MVCATEGQAVPDRWSRMCKGGTQGGETGGLSPGRAHSPEPHHCSGQEPPLVITIQAHPLSVFASADEKKTWTS